jgi:hypothetical protein
MSDYVLTATRSDGEPIRLEFDKFSDAEEVMAWAQARTTTQTIEIRGMGYPIAWFRRDGCQVCEGRAQVPDYDRFGNIVGIADCAECGGTGVVKPLVDSYRREPVEAGTFDCPLCHQPVPLKAPDGEYLEHDISGVTF